VDAVNKLVHYESALTAHKEQHHETPA